MVTILTCPVFCNWACNLSQCSLRETVGLFFSFSCLFHPGFVSKINTGNMSACLWCNFRKHLVSNRTGWRNLHNCQNMETPHTHICTLINLTLPVLIGKKSSDQRREEMRCVVNKFNTHQQMSLDQIKLCQC